MEGKREWNTLNQALCDFLIPCIYMRKRKYDKNRSSVIKNVHKAYNKLILNNVHEPLLYVSFLLLLKIEPTYRSSIQVCFHSSLIYGYRGIYPMKVKCVYNFSLWICFQSENKFRKSFEISMDATTFAYTFEL